MLGHVLLGMLIGITITFIYAVYKVASLLKELERVPEVNLTDTKLRVVVEKEQQHYYCYGVEDRVFVCQGGSLQELSRAFKLRYPGKLMYIVGGDSEALRELSPNNT